MHFFEDGFDYHKYIEDRLLEVGDLNERKELKEVMRKTLLPFYEQVEEAYRLLEEKLLQKEAASHGACHVITGIEDKDRIDVTDSNMVPMLREDMEEKKVEIAELMESMDAGREHYVYTVYIGADYLKLKALDDAPRVFRGTVRTVYEEEFPARFCVRRCDKYIGELKKLYAEFINNGVSWHTVCAPYIYKMYDVFITETGCPNGEEIDRISVDFEEYASEVEYDRVPMWNISTLEIKTSSYPDFALDNIHYLHTIYESRLDVKKDYLVAGDIPLWDVSMLNGELRIQCDESAPVNWVLREFSYEKGMITSGYRQFYNTGGGMDRPIHTIAEAKRFVDSLGYDDCLQLTDIRLDSKASRDESYDMDAFLMEEIRHRRCGERLLFVFEPADAGNVLNRDIMSYLVSRLQMIYPEYLCRGILK